MKENKSIKYFFSRTSIVLIALLLVIAPCKVRKSIQAFFDIEQTDSSNKEVTTLESLDCARCELPTVQSGKPQKVKELHSLNNQLTGFIPRTGYQFYNILDIKVFDHLIPKQKVPLYLLFQSFTFYF